MTDHEKPSYWAVLPATVRYDAELPPNAKLLYGEISALCDIKGYCYATNAYFAGIYGWSVPTIQRLLSALRERGYIRVEIVRDKRTNSVEERRIYAGLQVGVTPPLKNEGRSPQKQGDPPLKNDFPIKEEQSNKNNTPLPPKGGQSGRRKKKAPRAAPDWKPERFAGLWVYYPKRGRQNKQDAMDAWDNLRPSDELIDTIALALKKLKASDLWQRGHGIPYVATFLRNARWENAEELEGVDGDAGGEVYEDRKLL